MTVPAKRDLPISHEQLSELIGLIYDSAFETPQWKSFLERLHTLFPEIGGCTYVTEGEIIHPPVVTIGGSDVYWSDAIQCAMRNVSNELAFASMRGVGNGWIARTQKYIDETHYTESALYTNYLSQGGYRHAQHLILDQREDRGAYLALTFPDDLEAHDRLYLPVFELMKLLAPHAVRAFQLARMVNMSRRANEALGGFLDAIILPMVVVDGRGRFAFANAAGRRMLDRGDRLAVTSSGDLFLSDADDTQNLRRRIAEVENTLAPGGMRIWSDDRPQLLCLTPFRATMEGVGQLDRHLLEEERLVAVFLGQPPSEAIDTGLLRDVFDLTPREAEVAQMMITGASAAEIAEVSDRALKTVRNQVQMVYDKVGVTSNAQLMDTLSVFRTVGTMFESEASARIGA